MPEVTDRGTLPEEPVEEITESTARDARDTTSHSQYTIKPDDPTKFRLSKWYQDYLGSDQRARNLAMNPPSWQPDPPRMPNDAYKSMENYEKITGFERWLSNAFQSGIPQATEKLKDVLPDPIEKAVFGAGSAALKFLSIFDLGAEFVERGSGFIMQYRQSQKDGTRDEFLKNAGDAWAAGSMTYDISNTILPGRGAAWNDPQIPWHTDLPSTSGLKDIRNRITELVDGGLSRKEALEQAKAETYDDMGALVIRAIKQDIAGHIFFDPLLIASAMGYAPIDIVKKASVEGGGKYLPGTLEHMEDCLAVAKKADDLDEVARLTGEIAKIEAKGPLTAGDKVAMFLTGNFPEPLEGAGKVEKALYYVGNQLAHSESKILRTWQRFNPLSLTPEARAHEWMNRIDNYLGTHVLSQADPHKIVDDLVELASQATSGKVSAMSVTSDGRMIQSFLRSGELSAETLLADFMATSADGKFVMELARRLDVKTPDLIDDILDGKTASIVKRLADMGGENATIASSLTDDVFKRLGALKGKPFTAELFKRSLQNQLLDQMAQIGIVQFGVKNKGLIQKWNSFMKAGETLAFLRINPTFAARNWINNEFTMIARGVGGDFFGNGIDDLLELTEKLGFSPLRASQAFTMAGLEADTLGEIGQAAQMTIAKQLEGDAIFLDKWAKAINKAELGPLDFGKLAQRAEASASRKAITKGYTRAWRQFWTPDNFTSASKFLPQEVIREVGEDAIRQLDNLLADAGSLDDITNIFANIDNIDLNRSVSGAITDVEQRLGINLSDQFEDFELEKIRSGLDKALNAKSRQEVREIFDELNESAINKIIAESDARLQTKLEMFENAVEAERGMALIGVTEELTNQLDVFEYLYSTGMSRFRPQDVSKSVRDMYWPVWLEQQNKHFAVVNKRVDAAIDGIKAGGQTIDLNLDQALNKLQGKRKIWDGFFEWRNGEYDLFFKGEGKYAKLENGWDMLIEEINMRYISAADTDMAVIKSIDDIMVDAVRISNPDLADGFAGWRSAIREWKITDRRMTRTYTYGKKTADPMVDGISYSDWWKMRGEMQVKLGDLKARGYAMMEGDASQLAYFSGLVDDVSRPSEQAIRIAENLEIASQAEVSNMSRQLLSEIEPFDTMPTDLRREGLLDTDYQAAVRGLGEEARYSVETGDTSWGTDIHGTTEQVSLHRQWYKDLTNSDLHFDYGLKNPPSKASVESALKNLIDGTPGSGKTYTMVKDTLFRRLADGGEGIPGNPYFKMLLDGEDAAIDMIRNNYDTLEMVRAIDVELADAMLLKAIDDTVEESVEELLASGALSAGNQAQSIAEDLSGQATTFRAGQLMDSELGPMFPNEAKEEQWFARNFWTLKELEEEAASKIGMPAARLDVSDYAKGELEKFLNGARSEMADAQYGALQMAEYYRDAALLNYNRKMNYDTWLGTFMPYEFWMTHSLGQWAIQSINRPAMLSFYMRLREMQNRIAIEDDSFPTRLKGKFKIKIPPGLGMQEWMGDSLFVDPLNWILPFGQMTMPYQMAVQRGLTNQGRIERELDRMVQDGEISRTEADQAMATQSGRAYSLAVTRMEETAGEQTDNYELLTALSSMHAPYDIAYKALSGKPEEIGPFLPATFTVNRLMGMFGVDWANSKMNAPARIRRWMGLPGFDQWETYRPERMLSNMSATGEITPDQAARAMVEHSGVAWELARKKAAKEYAGGPWWVALLKTVGLPAYIYPEGEQHQRQLSDDFERAMQAYEDGDTESYNKFFDQNPEFANRLALFDEPEERMQKFMADEVRNLYFNLSTLDKKIAREALGDEFVMRFLDKETRNYDAIPTEQLQLWAKMMGGDPVGTLPDAFPITFAPPEIASGAQIFYDTRAESFPTYYELQNKYFMLADAARKDFLVQNPELKQYWDWRRDFLKRNPAIAPYIDDNFEPNYGSVQEMEQAFENQPQFGQREWYNYLGGESFRLVTSAYNGEVLPIDIRDYLEDQAESMGLTYEELVDKVGTAP